MLNDVVIIEKLLSGNNKLENEGISTLYKELRKNASHIVLNNSGNEDDLEDVLQEGIMAFYDNISIKNSIMIKDNKIINKKGDFVKITSYMSAVFRNNWFMKLREKKRIVNDELINLTEEPEDVYEEKNTFKKNVELVYENIKKMNTSCYEILTLFWIDKLNFETIALKLGHSNANTSKQIKARCQKKLKENILSYAN